MTVRPDGPLPDRRLAGVCLHVSSLPGPFGIGDAGRPARDFIDFAARAELRVWQFLPLGPTGFGNSPYQPLSSFAGNEMLIAVDDLVELGLLAIEETGTLRALPADTVDFEALLPVKVRLLDLAAARFERRASVQLKADFDEYCAQNDDTWLRDYALFRLLKSLQGGAAWPAWPADVRRREPGALRALEVTHRETVVRVHVQQFLFHRQWSALRRHARDAGVLLFGDLPIYIGFDSADAWSNPGLLRLDADGRPDALAGVPPDYFSEDGQLWGNPLYDWPRHAASGYAWWIARLRASLEQADLVRIDHFRGFESYWSVPADAATARDGRWEPGPGDAIFDALRAAFGRLPIVAENLGVITEEVEALRRRHGLPGMIVLQFAIGDPGFRLAGIDENEVCYTGTHDNDTTLGWFRGGDDTRDTEAVRATQAAALAVTGGSGASIARDLVRVALASRARLAIAPLQDLLELGSEARMNTPGRATGNWRWRVTASQLSAQLCDNVAGMIRKYR